MIFIDLQFKEDFNTHVVFIIKEGLEDQERSLRETREKLLFVVSKSFHVSIPNLGKNWHKRAYFNKYKTENLRIGKTFIIKL